MDEILKKAAIECLLKVFRQTENTPDYVIQAAVDIVLADLAKQPR